MVRVELDSGAGKWFDPLTHTNLMQRTFRMQCLDQNAINMDELSMRKHYVK